MEKNMPKPGAFCWNELMTPDAHKAKEFYRSLFGWEFQSKKVDNATYEMITAGGKPGGGLMQMTPDEASKIPPHWMTYVYVEGEAIMALLTAKSKSKRMPASLRFDAELISEIKSYNEWVGIERLEDFFDQAARYILEKDKDWQKKADRSASELT